MKRFKLALAIFSFTLIIILGSVILLLRSIGTSSLPQQDGKVTLSGIGSSTKVLRDSLGVPYIMAQSDSDVYFALGFAHAQDRLFQMEMYRDAGEGKLSETFGRKTLPIDELFRTLQFQEMADSVYQSSSLISKDILRWYCDGVNAYLSTAKALPAEFSILQLNPVPWKPQDCVIVARLMAWELNVSWWAKPVFGEVFDKLGPEKAALLIPLFARNAKPDIKKQKLEIRKGKSGVINHESEISNSSFVSTLDNFLHANSDALNFISGVKSPDGIGSNNWTISSSKTNTGSAILCNDPHLALSLPAKWYLVSISSPSLRVMGVTLPGTPGVVIGRNENISWGMTNVMADDADFYFVQADSTESDYYWYDGKLLSFQSFTDTINVKGEPPYVFTKRTTIQGPVVSDVIANSYRLSALHGSSGEMSGIVSLRWNAYWPSDETRAVFLINIARNFQDFLNALRSFGTPAQNFVYADVRGNIGFKAAGNIPLRNYPMPYLPQTGTSSRFVWENFVPFDALPESYNPPSAFIATANDKTTPDNYPYYLTNLYEPSSRIDRITSFIFAHDTMSVELCKELQLDYQSEFMSLLNDKLLAACNSERYFPKELVYLKNFDGRMNAKSTAAAILNETFVELVKGIFEPVLGDSLFAKYILVSSIPTRILETMLKNPTLVGQLYDTTNDLSAQRDLAEVGDSLMNIKLSESLESSLETLREKFGFDPINWMWGKIHMLELKHPMSSNSLIKKLYDLGPFSRGGTNTTVNNGEFSLDEPYNMLVGPSMRMIVDMNKYGMYFSLPGGECGQLLSAHYSDFLGDYLNGKMKFFPMQLSAQNAAHALEFTP
ncbi:MAG: penicillin acylase family protein [Candidatus Kryptoniota bacterium]